METRHTAGYEGYRNKNKQCFVPCWIAISTVIFRKKTLQLILGLFTHEMHNIMLNTSIGSFLFGVVTMLKVTLSTVQVLRSILPIDR